MHFILGTIIVFLIGTSPALAFSRTPNQLSCAKETKQISQEATPEVSAIERLWALPSGKVEAEIIKSYQRGKIKVEEIYYQSRTYQGKPAKIFAYFCYPANAPEKLPAILLSHGGGGTAHLGRSLAWARRGYAVLTLDLPGKGEQRASSRSTGPDMDVPTLLKTTPNPEDNYLVHAVAATRNGITYLTQREEVDPERIAMVGLSWGGVLTILTNGQDKRLKTAVNVFGAGYIPEGCTWQTRFDLMEKEELAAWNTLIDPKNFLKSQHAPILFITGTNDHCYYLPTFQKSYAQVTVPKKLYLVPNLRHKFLEDTQSIVWRWLDDKLKYAASFPKIDELPIYVKENHKLIIPVAPTTHWKRKVKSATLYYAMGQPTRWTKRVWKSFTAYQENGIYYFALPVSSLAPEILFYVNVEDNKGAVVSTPIRSIFKVDLPESGTTFAISSPIKKVSVHARPVRFLGITPPKEAQLYFSKKDNTYHLIVPKTTSATYTL